MLQKIRNRFADRSLLAIFQLLLKIGFMYARGLWWKLWLKQSSGLLLIGRYVTIHNPQYISVGTGFVAENSSEIQGVSKEGIIFGNNVTIGSYAMIRPSGYYGREIGIGLKVGNDSNIGPYCFIGCSGRIEIGNNVMMSPRVSIYSENHNFARVDIPMKEQGVTRGVTIIEDDCWIASNSIILSDVRIGRGAVIAAGSVVSQDVPPYAVVAGVPARVVKMRRLEDSISVQDSAILHNS